jgi:hypothetical protein
MCYEMSSVYKELLKKCRTVFFVVVFLVRNKGKKETNSLEHDIFYVITVVFCERLL